MYHKSSGSIHARGIMPCPTLEEAEAKKIVAMYKKYVVAAGIHSDTAVYPRERGGVRVPGRITDVYHLQS
jgi:hypothetical protein